MRGSGRSMRILSRSVLLRGVFVLSRFRLALTCFCSRYTIPSSLQMTAFLDWLNPKGHREIKLLDSLKRWWEYLHKGAEKRHIVSPSPLCPSPLAFSHSLTDPYLPCHVCALQDALSRVHNPTGRQTRHTNTTDQRNHPSLNWRNRKADPMPR